MSNILNIVPTTFYDVNSGGEVTGTSYGFRIYDDYGTHYVNTYESIDAVWEDINNDVEKLIHGCTGFEEIAFGNEIGECDAVYVACNRINLPVKLKEKL